MSLLRSLKLTLLIAVLAGCQSGLDQRYLDASLGQSLELPPDLSRQESESRFDLPENFAGDDRAVRDRVPVLANVDSLRLEGSAGLYWLSVEEPVEQLYQLVKNFWAAEGYRLVVDEPVIGIMQTEWLYKEEGTVEGSANWLERLFGEDDLFATQDQFRTRIERGESGASRIYVAHRGTQYKYELDAEDRSSSAAAGNEAAEEEREDLWNFRRPEPELEIEMLSRLMVYLGLQQGEVERQVADAKLFKPRAFLRVDAEENSPFIIIKDSYQIAWNRVYHNLERLNFDIANAQFKSGFSGEGVITVNTEVLEDEQEAGFFSSLFGAKKQVGRQFVLVLSEESHEWTRMNIENDKGEFDTTPEGAEFLSLLYEQIR